MRVAVVFPGQAALEAGSGLAFLRDDPHAADLVHQASDLCGADLARLLRRGGPELGLTERVQPLLAALCLAAWRRLEREDLRPDLVAGHSLGEVVAVAAAAGLSDAEVLALAAARGRLFADAARAHPGGMLALTTTTGFECRQAAELDAWLQDQPDLALAAINAPTERVLSGSAAGLARAQARFGGRRLDVPGPWHHPELADCARQWAPHLDSLVGRRLAVPFVSGIDGETVRDGAEAVRRLCLQVIRPVRWDLVLGTLRRARVQALVHAGAERILRGLVRLSGWRDVELWAAVDRASLADTVSRWKSQVALRGEGPSSR